MRGWAIVLMIWGHCVQCVLPDGIDFFENPVFKFIYSFHMPLFMFISGYLFGLSMKKRGVSEIPSYIGKRSFNLIRPITIGAIFIFVFGPSLIVDIKSIILGEGIESISLVDGGSLWFLWSVLVSTVALGFVLYFGKSTFSKVCLAVLLIPFVLAMPNGIYNIFMYPYFLFAVIYANIKERISFKFKTAFQVICTIAFCVMLGFFKREYYIYTTGMYSQDYSVWECVFIDLYRYIIGFVGTVFALSIGKIFWNSFHKLSVKSPLVFIGKHSLEYYVISVVVVSSWLRLFIKYVYKSFSAISDFISVHLLLFNLLIAPIATVLSLICLYLIIKLFEKLKINRLVFGK